MANISQIEVNGTNYDICDAIARDSLKGKVLYSGTLSEGQSATVLFESWSKYKIFGIRFSTAATILLGSLENNLTVAGIEDTLDSTYIYNLRCIAGHVTSTPVLHVLAANTTLQGNTFTFAVGRDVSIGSSSTSFATGTIAQLVGIY